VLKKRNYTFVVAFSFHRDIFENANAFLSV